MLKYLLGCECLGQNVGEIIVSRVIVFSRPAAGKPTFPNKAGRHTSRYRLLCTGTDDTDYAVCRTRFASL